MTDPSNVFRLADNLYNIIHGTNRYAAFLMGSLAILPDQVGRFRDCYMHRAPTGELEIHIYTRNGGGNRESHADVTAKLRTHPLYLRDFDDPFDATYATYAFRPNPRMRADLETFAKSDTEQALPRSHKERAEEFARKMKETLDDPEIKRIVAAVQPTFDRIAAALDDKPDESELRREAGRNAAKEDFESNSVAPETIALLKSLLANEPDKAISKIISISRYRTNETEMSEPHRPSWFAGYMREFMLRIVQLAKEDG